MVYVEKEELLLTSPVGVVHNEGTSYNVPMYALGCVSLYEDLILAFAKVVVRFWHSVRVLKPRTTPKPCRRARSPMDSDDHVENEREESQTGFARREKESWALIQKT